MITQMQIFRIVLTAVATACLLGLFAGEVSARTVTGSAYVRDADTIVVSGTPVRLNGIDAPEISNRYGREAQTFVQRLLRGQTVTCDLNGERSYNRWIGICYIETSSGAADLGAIIVANGHALDCGRYSGGRYRALETRGARSRLRQASYC